MVPKFSPYNCSEESDGARMFSCEQQTQEWMNSNRKSKLTQTCYKHICWQQYLMRRFLQDDPTVSWCLRVRSRQQRAPAAHRNWLTEEEKSCWSEHKLLTDRQRLRCEQQQTTFTLRKTLKVKSLGNISLLSGDSGSGCTLLVLSWWPEWCWSPLGALVLSVLCPLPALRVLPTLPVLPTLFLSPAETKTKTKTEWGWTLERGSSEERIGVRLEEAADARCRVAAGWGNNKPAGVRRAGGDDWSDDSRMQVLV